MHSYLGPDNRCTLNVVKFRTLCFKKCGLSGLELTKCLSMISGKTLIRLLVDLCFLCLSRLNGHARENIED